jgi:citrate lyase subunit beta / citryl-CoA lyase
MTAVPRSLLFVPATRPDRLGKAIASGADAVILDLEDAVAPAEKAAARSALTGALDPSCPVIVRINGVGSPWFADDLEACRAPGIRAVMLPKAETAAQVDLVHQRCGLAVIGLIETAKGVWNALEIAGATGTQRLAFGALDFRLDLDLPDTGYEQLAAYRARIVLASRVANRWPPLDSPTPTFSDLAVVRSDALAARALGFGGKLCIHPAQVPVVNESFMPSATEVEWAQRIVAAARSAAGAAIAMDGKMVDRPVLELAERILAQASAD